MYGATAGLVAVVEYRHRVVRRVCVWAPRYGLAFNVRAQVLAFEVAQLIVWFEICCFQPRTALETDHLHASLRELSGKNATSRAHADDHNICFFFCHGSAPLTLWPVSEVRRLARA